MCYVQSQGVTKVITIHPKGNINVCTKFHVKLSNSSWDITVWTSGGPTFPSIEKCH